MVLGGSDSSRSRVRTRACLPVGLTAVRIYLKDSGLISEYVQGSIILPPLCKQPTVSFTLV